jgi:hypothetical protein
MNAKEWTGTGLLLAIVALALLSCQDQSRREVEFSSGCTDIADLWGNLPEDKRGEECYRLLDSHSGDLAEMGFATEDCEVVGAEAEDCKPALGTRLACTYECGDRAE